MCLHSLMIIIFFQCPCQHFLAITLNPEDHRRHCIQAPPKRGRYWEIHPLRSRDFPWPSRFSSGLRPREISWASGMYFPIPPSFWCSSDTIMLLWILVLYHRVPATSTWIKCISTRVILLIKLIQPHMLHSRGLEYGEYYDSYDLLRMVYIVQQHKFWFDIF